MPEDARARYHASDKLILLDDEPPKAGKWSLIVGVVIFLAVLTAAYGTFSNLGQKPDNNLAVTNLQPASNATPALEVPRRSPEGSPDFKVGDNVYAYLVDPKLGCPSVPEESLAEHVAPNGCLVAARVAEATLNIDTANSRPHWDYVVRWNNFQSARTHTRVILSQRTIVLNQ